MCWKAGRGDKQLTSSSHIDHSREKNKKKQQRFWRSWRKHTQTWWRGILLFRSQRSHLTVLKGCCCSFFIRQKKKKNRAAYWAPLKCGEPLWWVPVRNWRYFFRAFYLFCWVGRVARTNSRPNAFEVMLVSGEVFYWAPLTSGALRKFFLNCICCALSATSRGMTQGVPNNSWTPLTGSGNKVK